MVVKTGKLILRSTIVSILGTMLLVCAIYCFVMPLANAQEQAEVPESFYEEISYEQAPVEVSALAGENDFYQDIILAVFTKQERLSSGIFAFERNGRYYLPIGALAEALGFKADVDMERRFVNGWTVSSNYTYSIDAINGVVQYNGNSTSVNPAAFAPADVASDDIYIDLEVFPEIWPVELAVEMQSLILRVQPFDKLPFQRALERKKKQEKAMQRKERYAEMQQDLPFVAMPYQLYSNPTIGVDASLGYNARQDSPEYRFALAGVQDLLYASADYSVNISESGGVLNKPENIRLRFRRQNIHEGALPFGLEDTQWGDVNLRNRDLISTGNQGRGLIFSTRKNNFSNEFDKITVEGVSRPGWEAELYLNELLIDYGVVDETGVYRFEDVGIGFGSNTLRVVLYGPQGEIEERTENYFYQSNMVKPGETEVSGGFVEAEKDLIPIDERDRSRPQGLAANVYASHGVNDRLTLFASANTVKDREGQEELSRQYLTTGAIGTVGTTLAQAEVYKQIGAGAAADLRTLSDFKGFKINTQTSVYNNFESPDAQDGPSAKRFQFEFDIRKVFNTFIGSLSMDAGYEFLKRESGATNTSYTTRQSLGIKGGTRISNQTRTTLSNDDHTATSGRLSSTSRFKEWTWRNNVSYGVFPDTKISSMGTELRYGRLRDFSTAFRLERNMDIDETIAGVQVTRDFDKFLGSVDATWSSKFGASIMARASTSFGPYGKNGSYLMSSDPLRNSGPISSFVYHDRDYDGTFSEGDVPVPNTKLNIGRRQTKDETDEAGYLAEINPATGGALNVSVARSSIDDPYLEPGAPGYRIFPRPGVVHNLEFPLIETGAIDGTLRWAADRQPIGGLKLQLMDHEGEFVKSSVTAADGYFTFEKIPPGSYTIRADPETGYNIPFKQVVLTPDNLFQFGMDIDAVDLNAVVQTDMGEIEVDKDGVLSVKNILSIAKGFKSRQRKGEAAEATTIPAAPPSSVGGVKVSGGAGAADVQAVRIGEHPDKVRVVMDLSGPAQYSLNYDPQTNSISVDMPASGWTARTNWQAKSGGVINSYTVEQTGGGTRMIMKVADGANIGTSGLLKAHAGKKDRLYIDITKK